MTQPNPNDNDICVFLLLLKQYVQIMFAQFTLSHKFQNKIRFAVKSLLNKSVNYRT